MAGRNMVSSKFKHSVGKAGKNDTWYTGLQVNVSGADSSSLLAASAHYVAFPYGTSGGTVGLVPVGKPGKYDSTTRTVAAHGSGVTDLVFSPFHDDLLATASEDSAVKLWTIPAEGKTLTDATAVLPGHTRRVEAIRFHPTADHVLASASGPDVRIWDVAQAAARVHLTGHGDVVQSISWRGDGTVLASTCKDTKLRIWDPRASASAPAAETVGHVGVKASVALWLGDLDRILTTGFTKTREREMAVWDARALTTPIARETIDNAPGILLPFFDADTNMLFFAGKGDSSIRWYEFVDAAGKFFSWPGGPVGSDTPQKGAALLPKRAVDCMNGEVNRLFKLTQTAIIPIPFVVPRKTYSVFHDDLFPETAGLTPGSAAAAWFDGSNERPAKISLDPSRSGNSAAAPSIAEPVPTIAVAEATPAPISTTQSPPPVAVAVAHPATTVAALTVKTETVSLAPSTSPSPGLATPASAAGGTISRAFKPIVRESKFRYITGKALHPSNSYTHITDVAIKMGGDTNVLQASSKYLAVPLTRPGGQIGIITIGKCGRQPTKLPAFVNGSEVLDCGFSPFDPALLAVGCEDGHIRLWRVPDGGLAQDVNEPLRKISGHGQRINALSFHPLAENVLVTTANEQPQPSIKYWNVATGELLQTLTGFTDLVFGFAHSYDGARVVVVSKDTRIRVYDVRSGQLLQEGACHEGTRGARVVWLGNSNRVASVGWNKASEREIRLYDATNLAQPLTSLTIDVSPGLLAPHYDEDTGVLYLWGRGDSSTTFYEFGSDPPGIYRLTKFDTGSLQIGVAFRAKTVLDVKAVEIAQAFRLSNNQIDVISFTVPRAKPAYFQEDLFPPTRLFDKPAMTADEWIAGSNNQLETKSLQPEGMKPLSEAPVEVKAPKFESRTPDVESDLEKRDKVLDSMFTTVKEKEDKGPLKQDLMEGVAEEEWLHWQAHG